MKKSTMNSLRSTASAIGFFYAFAAMPVHAQTGPEEDALPPAEQTQSSDGEIVVTGTSISGVKPVGTEAIVLTREDAEKTGFTTPADLLRTLPQVRAGEHDREGGVSTISVQNASQSNSVTLRGLISTSSTTLVLVDGRRTVGTGANTTSIEANQVPLAALERIEVVADGASAIYGSDAIGGVINFILRKDYEGAEVSLRANNTQGGFETGLSMTGGLSWDGGGLGPGNLLVTYDYANRESYLAGKNPYLRFDLSPLGGPDRRINGGVATLGFVPSIVVTPDPATNPPQNTTLPRALTSVYYGIPAGNGRGLTFGNLLLNQPSLTEFSNFTDYIGKQDRHQVAVYLNQALGESIEFFVQGRYTNRETLTRSTEAVGTTGTRAVLLPSVLYDNANQPTTTPNPFYVFNVPGVSQGSPAFPGFPPFIPPRPAQPAAALTVLYPALKDFGVQTYLGTDESVNVTAGIKAELPYGWKGELAYTVGRNNGCTYCLIGSYVNPEALQYQINIGAINPLSSEPLSADLLGKISGTQRQIGHNGIDNVLLGRELIKRSGSAIA